MNAVPKFVAFEKRLSQLEYKFKDNQRDMDGALVKIHEQLDLSIKNDEELKLAVKEILKEMRGSPGKIGTSTKTHIMWNAVVVIFTSAVALFLTLIKLLFDWFRKTFITPGGG